MSSRSTQPLSPISARSLIRKQPFELTRLASPRPSLASRQHAASLHSHPARTHTLTFCFWTHTTNPSPSAGQPTLPPSSMAAYTDRPHLSEAYTKSQLYHPSRLGEALAELAIKSYVSLLLILW